MTTRWTINFTFDAVLHERIAYTTTLRQRVTRKNVGYNVIRSLPEETRNSIVNPLRYSRLSQNIYAFRVNLAARFAHKTHLSHFFFLLSSFSSLERALFLTMALTSIVDVVLELCDILSKNERSRLLNFFFVFLSPRALRVLLEYIVLCPGDESHWLNARVRRFYLPAFDLPSSTLRASSF